MKAEEGRGGSHKGDLLRSDGYVERAMCFQIRPLVNPSSSIISCVTSDKLLNLSELHLQGRKKKATSQHLCTHERGTTKTLGAGFSSDG
jgi:hypothetical protein